MSVCLYVCKSQMRVSDPWNWSSRCEPLCVCREPNPRSSGRAALLFTTEPAFLRMTESLRLAFQESDSSLPICRAGEAA